MGNIKSFHRNIEFDQIIFIEKEINNTFPITIFNSDGGEISACGNGSRCVAYLLSKDLNNKEINCEDLINDITIYKVKLADPVFVYSLCTKERTSVIMNNLLVYTWSQVDWENYATLNKITWFKQ